LRKALLQGWLVFCVVALVGLIVFAIFDGDNIFTSDDPYIMGALFGSVAGVLAALYAGVTHVTGKPRHAVVVCAVALLTWSCPYVALSFTPMEGSDMAGFVGIASIIVGALAWPLYRVSFPKRLQLALSVAGVVYLLAWAVITVRL